MYLVIRGWSIPIVVYINKDFPTEYSHTLFLSNVPKDSKAFDKDSIRSLIMYMEHQNMHISHPVSTKFQLVKGSV